MVAYASTPEDVLRSMFLDPHGWYGHGLSPHPAGDRLPRLRGASDTGVAPLAPLGARADYEALPSSSEMMSADSGTPTLWRMSRTCSRVYIPSAGCT